MGVQDGNGLADSIQFSRWLEAWSNRVSGRPVQPAGGSDGYMARVRDDTDAVRHTDFCEGDGLGCRNRGTGQWGRGPTERLAPRYSRLVDTLFRHVRGRRAGC